MTVTRRQRRTIDTVTVLRAADDAVLTKRISQARDSEWLITAYDRGFWFAVEAIPVTGLVELGRLLACLERDATRCVIRGAPLPGIDRTRCRRLLYALINDDGQEVDPTFEAAPRRWIALDFDELLTPQWDPDDLARRREAILADYGARNTPDADGRLPTFDWAVHFDDEAERALHDVAEGIAGDADPAPIDPVADWALVCRAAVATLPAEFHAASVWWQMTSSAGIKPGVRLRLWYWLDRPVSDAECKRWLADAPVDLALYSPVQVHYVAAPLFDPPDADPVPIRSGWWWRHTNVVQVPDLPEPAPVDLEQAVGRAWSAAGNGSDRRARAYAEASLHAVASAPAGTRHPTLLAVAVRLYSLCDAGLLDPGEVTRQLLAAAEAPLSPPERAQRCARQGGRPSQNEQALDWARARAVVAPDLPEGF